MNTIPCNQCVHYNEQSVYKGEKRPAAYGWCNKKSEYPAREWDGAVFELGVKRVDPEAHRSKPVIVIGTAVQAACLDVLKAPAP